MRKEIKTLMVVLLCSVFLISLALMGRQFYQYELAKDLSDEAARIASGSAQTEPEQTEGTVPPEPTKDTEPSDPSEPTQPSVPEEEPMDDPALELAAMDIAALQEVNPDVLGWILIPGTEVSYVLMCADTYDEYLYTAWDGTSSTSGSIYLAYENSRDFTDFNSVIYGHNMRNGTMFGSLKNFGDQEYFDTHPYIYIVTGDTVYRYAVFAAFIAPITSDCYRINHASEERKETAISYFTQSSSVASDIRPQAQDHILTLSTCTGLGDYNYRWVVQGVLDMQWTKK